MHNLESTSNSNTVISWGWTNSETLLANPNPTSGSPKVSGLAAFFFTEIDLLKPLRRWLDNVQFSNSQMAHRVCQLVPAQCPFERDVALFGHVLFHIPPMCKLNPLYEEVVGLRFRALCYLADECGEDISCYC